MKASERHRLKQDKFVQTIAQAVEWTRRHQRPIIIAAAVLVFAVVCSAWLVISRRSADEAARGLLREAETRARIALLEKPEAQANAVREVLSRCDFIAADYPNAAAAPLALLQAGRVLVLTGQAKEAVPYFERALKLAGSRKALAVLARRGLAEALEDAGRPREAIAQYSILLAENSLQAAVQANWDIGRCYEELGQTARAIEFYRKADERGGNSAWAEMARFRLSHLLSTRRGADAQDVHHTRGKVEPKGATQPAPADKKGSVDTVQ